MQLKQPSTARGKKPTPSSGHPQRGELEDVWKNNDCHLKVLIKDKARGPNAHPHMGQSTPKRGEPGLGARKRVEEPRRPRRTSFGEMCVSWPRVRQPCFQLHHPCWHSIHRNDAPVTHVMVVQQPSSGDGCIVHVLQWHQSGSSARHCF
jgi:hypothetical protein